MRVARRRLEVALGLLWLLDGALQLQPVMFTRRFARGIVAPAGAGQVAPVHWSVATAASVIGAHPVVFDALFASVQLLLGAGLLWRRAARWALGASIAWAHGVWLFGEGLGGIFGSGATLLDGAPGAAVLYALLAAVALEPEAGGRWPVPARRWVPVAWVSVWSGLAVLALLPGSAAGGTIAAGFTANLAGLPAPLASIARALAGDAAGAGPLPGAVLAAACLAIGLAGLRPGRVRVAGAVGGAALATFTWVFAEAFGAIGTGQATDPNSGPLLVLFAAVLCSPLVATRRRPAGRRSSGDAPALAVGRRHAA